MKRLLCHEILHTSMFFGLFFSVFLPSEIFGEEHIPEERDLACHARISNLVHEMNALPNLPEQFYKGDSGGDKEFFLNEDIAPPNIIILFDNSGSMRWMVDTYREDGVGESLLDIPNGCGGVNVPKVGAEYQVQLNLQNVGYDRNVHYPDYHPDGYPGSDSNFGGFSGLYERGKIYKAEKEEIALKCDNSDLLHLCPDHYQGTEQPLSFAEFCSDKPSEVDNDCLGCLQKHGFYFYANEGFFDGNYLNLNPPRFVQARRAVVGSIAGAGNVRLGVAVFNTHDDYVIMEEEGKDIYRATWINSDDRFVFPNCKDAYPWTSLPFYASRTRLIRAINDLTIFDMGANTPLANSLLNLGQFFSDLNNKRFRDWGFCSEGTYCRYTNPRFTRNPDNFIDYPVCWGCQNSAVVIVTDGAPYMDNTLIPDRIRNLNAADHDPENPESPISDCPECGYDGYYPELPNVLHKVAWWFRNVGNNFHPVDTCDDHPCDINARWGGEDPLNIFTYTIGFVLDHDLLVRTADAGDGRYYTVDEGMALQRAISAIIEDVLERSSSFTTTALATIQALNAENILIPRFESSRYIEPWKGDLLRFDFVSEFVIGKDLDGDGEESGFFLIDKACEAVENWTEVDMVDDDQANQRLVQYGENILPDCVPIREATASDVALNPEIFELGKYYRTLGFRRVEDEFLLHPDAIEAVPFWSAEQELKNREGGPLSRKLFAHIDDGNGNLNAVRLIPENAEEILPHLGLDLSYSEGFCLHAARRVPGFSFNNLTDCAKVLIKYVLGCRLPITLAEMNTLITDNLSCVPRDGDRDKIMGDVFHSTPTVIEPPTVYELMGSPFRHEQTPWALINPKCNDIDCDPEDAYRRFICGVDIENCCCVDAFYQDGVLECSLDGLINCPGYRTRDRVALLGTNWGILHAIHVGGPASGSKFRVEFDRGSGEELWGLIPATVLSRIQYLVMGQRHRYFIDGDPWIKNIWVDSGKNGWHRTHQDEFRTIAILGHREGGNRHFALDVTDAHREDYKPDPLWYFPEIGSYLDVTVGQSWNDVQPKPAPIGPIRYHIQSDVGSEMYHQGIQFRERWVTFLPGGYDRWNVRGKGWYMLDAYTGELLWEYVHPSMLSELNPGANLPDSDDPRWNLNFSIAAVPTITAWGDSASYDADAVENNYFDTLIVGDTGGQVWVGRFGHPNPDNWAGARVFEPGKSGVGTGSAWNQFFLSSAHLTRLFGSDYLRAYIGTGDRQNIRQPGAGICSLDNMRACIMSEQCETIEFDYAVTYNDEYLNLQGCEPEEIRNCINLETMDPMLAVSYEKYMNNRTRKRAEGFNSKRETVSADCPKSIWFERRLMLENCNYFNEIRDPATGGTTDKLESLELKRFLGCNLYDNGENIQCGFHDNRGDIHWYLPCVKTDDIGNNRFYSLRIFSENPHQPELLYRLPFNNNLEAIQFDKSRLTDYNFVGEMDEGQLKEFFDHKRDDKVRRVRADEQPTPYPVGRYDAGWYYEYLPGSERTASSAETVLGCVVWSALEAAPKEATGPTCGFDSGGLTEEEKLLCDDDQPCPCVSPLTQKSFMYFRNYITGENNCIHNWPEYVTQEQRDEGRLALGMEAHAPPAPQVVTQVSTTGQVLTSIATTYGGADISDKDDLVQFFTLIDVPADLHKVRHVREYEEIPGEPDDDDN